VRLADGGAAGLMEYVRGIQKAQGLPDDERLQLRQLGRASGVLVNAGTDRQIAVLAFTAGLFAWALLLLVADNLRRWLVRREEVAWVRMRRSPEAEPYFASDFDVDAEEVAGPFLRSGR
jgi:hypothetical protein